MGIALKCQENSCFPDIFHYFCQENSCFPDRLTIGRILESTQMASIKKYIKEDLKNRGGDIIFPEDYLHLGSPEAIHKALSRLTKEKELVRLAKGIYLRQVIDEIIGPIVPPIEEIAKAIAEKEHVVIRPTGAYAMNKLGISTQVPMKVVFLTDGQSRSIKIGRGRLTFKRVRPKLLGAKNELVYLAIQALEELGKQDEETQQQTFEKIRVALANVTREAILADAKYAPQRITKLLHYLVSVK